MTTEIEKQFFECFGIEKQDVKMPYGEWEYFYPEITAEKLLELLCIVIDEYNHNGHNFSLDATNIEELKTDILDALMGCIDATCDLFEDRVNEVRKLFEEER